jgi:hypothetical protein
MQSEEFDKRIKQAAEQYHPAYDEKAWSKMKKILDVHMPQENKRRRGLIFFLFAACLLIGGGVFLISKQNNRSELARNSNTHSIQTVTPSQQNIVTSPGNEKTVSGETAHPKGQSNSANGGTTANEPVTASTNTHNVVKEVNSLPKNTGTSARVDKAFASDKNIASADKSNQQRGSTQLPSSNGLQKNSRTNKVNSSVSKVGKTSPNNPRSDLARNKKQDLQDGDKNILKNGDAEVQTQNAIINSTATAKPTQENNNAETQTAVKNSTTVVNKPIEQSKDTKQSQEVKNSTGLTSSGDDKKPADDKDSKASTKKVRQNSGGKNTGFGFTVSAGPDVSQANAGPGKLKMLYGAGIQYSFAHIRLGTGVYFARKIYTATASDYKISYSPPYTTFTGADANCKVLEVPVTFDYLFANRKNSNWFAALGLSSYFMQDERYQLNYKLSTGQSYEYHYHVTEKNKHYFSVLDLSAGYTRQLSPAISITAQPYLKIPLTGIGEGKVHLNSGGVLFTVGISPIRKHGKSH